MSSSIVVFTPHYIRSLAEVPGLERVLEVCEQFDVEITAFGSVVRRLARHVFTPNEVPKPDLFCLAPFLSDIDLRHTGKPEQTAEIRQAILSRVPWSECFRWEIFSETELLAFRKDEERLPVIPANKLTLSTRAGTGIQDPFDAKSDLVSGLFRLLANPFYNRSRLRLAGRDCLLVHAIFFLQLVLEESDSLPNDHPGWKVCQEFLHSDWGDVRTALSANSYLRRRVLYRLLALRAARTTQMLWTAIFQDSGLDSVLRAVDTSGLFVKYLADWQAKLPRAFAAGCNLPNGTTRLQETGIEAPIAEDAAAQWAQIANRYAPATGLSNYPLPNLGLGQHLCAVSPHIGFHRGIVSCSNGWEQVHLEFPVSSATAALCRQPDDDGGLGVLALLTASTESRPDTKPMLGSVPISLGYIVPLPAICVVRDYELANTRQHSLQTRVNFGRLLEVFPQMIAKTNSALVQELGLKLFFVANNE